MLKSTVTESGDLTCVSLEGRIDGLTSSDVERQLKELLLKGCRNLMVDFGQISYISSAGLRVFLLIQKQLKQAGGELVLAALKPEVREVFRVCGFLKMFRIVDTRDAASSPDGSSPQTADTSRTVVDSITLVRQKVSNAAPAALLSIGTPDKLSRAVYDERDVVSVTSSQMTFGTGLATVGEAYADYKDFFGEAVVINRNIFFFPATRRPVVDFIVQADENFELTYRFFHGFGFHGPFKHLVSFDGGGIPVELSRLRTALMSLTESEAAGIVILAESKGVWGMHLKQVPTADHAPANDDDIFSGQNFPHWFDFPVEAGSTDHIVAAAGIALRDGATPSPALRKVMGGNDPYHFHGCIFQKDILGKKPEHFGSELHRVLTELAPIKVQHLLGQSTFSSGLAGIVDLGATVETTA